ncbi:hypothetical protein Tco_1420435 [Tanacetum coccineum]
MAGPSGGGGPEGQDNREVTPPPLTKEQIEGNLSALRDTRVVKGKEVVDDNLRNPFKEALKKPLTCRIIEFSCPKYKMPTNIKLYDWTTDMEDHLGRFASAANSGE